MTPDDEAKWLRLSGYSGYVEEDEQRAVRDAVLELAGTLAMYTGEADAEPAVKAGHSKLIAGCATGAQGCSEPGGARLVDGARAVHGFMQGTPRSLSQKADGRQEARSAVSARLACTR